MLRRIKEKFPARFFQKKRGTARLHVATKIEMAEMDRHRRAVLQTQITIYDEASEKRHEANRANASGEN
ncbi:MULTISPECIES: hypothetical protein [Burkholderia]|uniref:hypothetical protein n=1 Tax=Burkholderia TaxID=32008 RepID=UPI0013CF0EF4|nr:MULTISPECIES: hypothetical protein [Burkholderia]MCA7887794.1 hypothetical protein [Burkholderia contaminans]